MHVGGLKVEEVKEGRVVDGERRPRRGERRGVGGKEKGIFFFGKKLRLFFLARVEN